MFHNKEDAIQWVISQPKFRVKTDLSLMEMAVELLDLHLDNIKKIHVAGTNGKGSTASFIAHILMENHYKVGIYTSPYLVRFNERIMINFIEISDDDLLSLINELYDFNQTLLIQKGVTLSFFELLTCGALLYFKRQQVDFIIMEVGIGGRYDATNVLDYDCSVITSIGYDHMAQLGNTLEEILDNKLGIIKTHNHLICAIDSPLKAQAIRYVTKMKSTIRFVQERLLFALSFTSFSYMNENYEIRLLGDYQRKNACLAIEVALYFNLSIPTIQSGLKKATWAGRLEKIMDQVYIDAAHNEPAMIALIRNIDYLFRHKNITILFSALGDKDIAKMLDLLKRKGHKVVLTQFIDDRYRDLSPFKTEDTPFVEDPIAFINLFQQNKTADDILLITGSIHFIGAIKNKIVK